MMLHQYFTNNSNKIDYRIYYIGIKYNIWEIFQVNIWTAPLTVKKSDSKVDIFDSYDNIGHIISNKSNIT